MHLRQGYWWSASGQTAQGLLEPCTGFWSLFQEQEKEDEMIRFLKISLATELKKDLERIFTFRVLEEFVHWLQPHGV